METETRDNEKRNGEGKKHKKENTDRQEQGGRQGVAVIDSRLAE